MKEETGTEIFFCEFKDRNLLFRAVESSANKSKDHIFGSQFLSLSLSLSRSVELQDKVKPAI
jgi:hypothetical protein